MSLPEHLRQWRHLEFGPGLKHLGGIERWYGPGYCGICGDTGHDLIPEAVRWWSPDDGWKMGVLCATCGREAAERGPRPDDFAVATRQAEDNDIDATCIEIEAELGDLG